MIHILCQGGLGNQLFILNIAELLYQKYECEISIVFDEKSRHLDRPIEIQDLVEKHFPYISIFNSRRVFRTFESLDQTVGRLSRISLSKITSGYIYDSKNIEAAYEFRRPVPKFVRGYFQNSEQVMQVLPQYVGKFESYLEMISIELDLPNDYQAFHIRRGDYVMSRNTLGELLPEFYQKTRSEKLPLLLSTDDNRYIAEIQENFPEARVIGPNELNSWQTFKVLAGARKLTMANSTFSWWAGAIAFNRGSEVIRPKEWNKVPTLSEKYLKHPGFIETESHFA